MARYLAKLDPEGPEPDPTHQRALTLVPHPDGRTPPGPSWTPPAGRRPLTALESIDAAGRSADDTAQPRPAAR